MPTLISRESPESPDARTLIAELEAELVPLYPQESRHGYTVDKLIAQGVAFFVVRRDGVPAGCGGIQLYGSEYGELKRMYVRSRHRGLGLARLMLDRHPPARRHRVVRADGLQACSAFRNLPRRPPQQVLRENVEQGVGWHRDNSKEECHDPMPDRPGGRLPEVPGFLRVPAEERDRRL